MLQTQQRLGDFEIIRLLGKGGMGEVYEAQQSNPERRVALKVLAPWLAENDEALTRFWREAAVPAQLDHPNIVRIISTGKTDNVAYYAMQLVRGISVAELVRCTDDVPPDSISQPTTDPIRRDETTCAYEPPIARRDSACSTTPIVEAYRRDRYRTTAQIGIQAAKALSTAHRQGFLHRDIKPSNLMIDHHDQLYLVDFGLTRALTSSAELTRNGTVVGTPWFMSPEQARGEPVDQRSDMFSLGVTLYQMVSGGRGPYTASRVDSDAVLRQVRDGTALPLRKVAPEVPEVLERIIERAIDVRPARRYQEMDELAGDLEAYLGTQGKSSNLWRFGLSRTRRRAAAYVGLAAVILLATFAGASCVYYNPFTWKTQEVERPPDPGQPPIEQPPPPEPWKDRRPIGVRQPLLREDNQPVIQKKVVGEGTLSALPTQLTLISNDAVMPTCIALAGTPKQWFEFRVDIKQMGSTDPNPNLKANNLGVFFGWQETLADRHARNRFFIAQLDRRPVLNDVNGRLKLGTAVVQEGEGALFDFFRPLAKEKGWIPLAAPPPDDNPWRTILVRVHNQKISVSVDKSPAQEFDVSWMQQNDTWLKGDTPEPRGLLGIWVRGGSGAFRNATLLPLAGDGDEKP